MSEYCSRNSERTVGKLAKRRYSVRPSGGQFSAVKSEARKWYVYPLTKEGGRMLQRPSGKRGVNPSTLPRLRMGPDPLAAVIRDDQQMRPARRAVCAGSLSCSAAGDL